MEWKGVLIRWNGIVEWNTGMVSEGIPYQDHPAHYSALVSRFSGSMEWESKT